MGTADVCFELGRQVWAEWRNTESHIALLAGTPSIGNETVPQ